MSVARQPQRERARRTTLYTAGKAAVSQNTQLGGDRLAFGVEWLDVHFSRRTFSTSMAALTVATVAAGATSAATAAAAAPMSWTPVRGQRQGDVFIVRTRTRPSRPRPMVLYHHGAGSSATKVRDKPASIGQRRIIESLAQAGYMVLVSDFGGDLFGSELNQRYISELIKVGRDRGGRSGKVALLGASMGGGAALAYAGNHSEDVACVVGLIPALDLSYIRTLLPSLVDPPYNGYDELRHGPRHSPLTMARQKFPARTQGDNAGVFSGMPIAWDCCTN